MINTTALIITIDDKGIMSVMTKNDDYVYDKQYDNAHDMITNYHACHDKPQKQNYVKVMIKCMITKYDKLQL